MKYANKNDEDLMALLKKQDHQAFDVLVRRHTERFYACAYRYCHDQDEAEDVVQESFLKIWSRPELWKKGKGAKFTTWFYRIVTNAAIDKVRAHKYHEGDDKIAVIEDESEDAFNILKQKQEQKGVVDSLEALTERQKSALILSFYEELSNKESADIMGLGLKAFESLLMRAKGSLRDVMLRKKDNLLCEKGGARYG